MSGGIEVDLSNRDNRRRYVVEIADLSYKTGTQRQTLEPGRTERFTVDTKRSFGWYDVGVRIDGDTLFDKCYAGRVETGNWGYSDPAMGRVVT